MGPIVYAAKVGVDFLCYNIVYLSGEIRLETTFGQWIWFVCNFCMLIFFCSVGKEMVRILPFLTFCAGLWNLVNPPLVNIPAEALRGYQTTDYRGTNRYYETVWAMLISVGISAHLHCSCL